MSSALVERPQTDNLESNQIPAQTSPSRVFVPRTDIYETADTIVVLADMPGVSEDSLDITLERNVLSIFGTVKRRCPQGFKLIHSDYEQGDFRRVFTLSNEIDREGIEATVKNGVLKLVLPKSKMAMPQKIAVRSV